jgi:hypothetical protein
VCAGGAAALVQCAAVMAQRCGQLHDCIDLMTQVGVCANACSARARKGVHTVLSCNSSHGHVLRFNRQRSLCTTHQAQATHT